MHPLLLPVVLLAAFLASLALAARASRHTAWRAVDHPQYGVMQGAMLGLLALMLGFSFSGAMSRFVERQDVIVREANAIGTAWLRAELLPEPHRALFRGDLRLYAEARIELFAEAGASGVEPVRARLSALHGALWASAVAGVRERPEATMAVLMPLNEAIDLLSVRDASARRHTPRPVMAVIIACSLASVASVGFGLATADPRLRVAAAVLAMLVAATLWIILDLDYPRLGFIQVSDAPLREALAGMSGTP